MSLPKVHQVDAWWMSGAWVFVEDTPALFFLRYLGGMQGRWGGSPGTSPHSGHYPPSGLGSMKVRWREIWHERGRERKKETEREREQAPY